MHVSTDCVFSGATGAYLESDHTDASDAYGKSALGEVFILTLLLFVPSLAMNYKVDMVIDWFLSQSLTVLFFSGHFLWLNCRIAMIIAILFYLITIYQVFIM